MIKELPGERAHCLDPRWSTTRRVWRTKGEREEDSGRHRDGALAAADRKAEGSATRGGLRTLGYEKRSEPDRPLISVVTAVLDAEATLERTVRSVIEQDYDNLEYIIVDGGSRDNTVPIIHRHQSAIDYWSSAPDEGLYDAMNRGIELARGDLIGIVNADDWYAEGALRLVAQTFLERGEAVVHGAMSMVPADPGRRFVSAAPERLGKLRKGMVVNHPTVFVPKSIYRKFGVFDTSYRIAADWDLMVRLWRAGVRFCPIPRVLANFSLGGISYRYDRRQVEEKRLIRVKNRICRGRDWHYLADRMKLSLPADWLIKATLCKQRWLAGRNGGRASGKFACARRGEKDSRCGE